MRVHYYAVFLAAALASAEMASDTRMTPSQILGTGTDAIATRFLRKHEAVDTTDDEERTFGIGFIDDIVRNVGNTWDDIAKTNELKALLAKRTNANDAYALLKVDKVTDNVLGSAEWKRWATYVKMAEPNNADEAMASAMVFNLKADNLSNMLAAAAKNPETKALATKLEGAQIKWWTSMTATPDDILKTLKLSKATDDMFDSPQLATFTKYLKAFNEKNNKKTTVLDVFKKSYGEDGLLKLLVSSQNGQSAGASKMIDEMLDGWMEFTKSPYSVFKALNLDKAGDDLLSNPLLSTWVKYMGQFNEKLPSKKTTMIETFLKSYGDESLTKMLTAAKKVPGTEKVATNLEKAKTALFEKWMVQGVTPDELFTSVLKLDKANLDTNPNANIWRAYHNAYDKANPGTLFSFIP